MPPAMARALNEIVSIDGHSAFALRDKFAPRISDIDLYTALGRERDWIAISKDVKNAKRRAEREAILRSGVLAFYLSPSVGKQSVFEQTATILWHWQKLVRQRDQTQNGLFELPIGKGSRFRSL